MRFSIPVNIGRLDQFIRLIISFCLIYIGFFDISLIEDEFSATIVGIFGALNMVASLARFCPLYVIADINTCRQLKNKED